MTAPNYPNNPTIGDTHLVGTITFQWDGEKWKSVTPGNHEARLDVLEQDPRLINDLSQAYEFATVAEMTASTIVLPIGKTIVTKGYYARGDAGAARYLIKAAQAFDTYGDHGLVNGTIAVLQGDKTFVKFGADNTGVASCTPSLIAFVAAGGVLYTSGIYDFGGLTTPIHQSDMINVGTVTFKNGEINSGDAGGFDVTIGDFRFEDFIFRIGGAQGNHLTNVKIGKLRFINSSWVPGFITDFHIEDIDVYWDIGDNPGRYAVGNLSCMYHGYIGRIRLAGYYAMGFQTAGNAAAEVYNTFDVHIGQLISERNPSSPDHAGWHGFYLLGNRKLTVDHIYSTGYSDSVGVANAVKFRDSWECTFGSIYCDSIQIASDANTSLPLTSLRDNVIHKLDLKTGDDDSDASIGSAIVTIGGSGAIHNNEIHWFRGSLTTSGAVPTDSGFAAFTLSNHVELSGTSQQQDNIVYKDAHMLSVESHPLVTFVRDLTVLNCIVDFDIASSNCNHEIRNSHIKGSIRGESTSGTFSSIVTNTTIDTTLGCSVYSARVWNATWVNVDALGVQPNPQFSLPDGVIHFRNASFSDRVYHTSLTDFTDLPV